MPVVVSRANKALVVPPEPGVLAMFDGAPALPNGNRILPHDLRSKLMLNHLGFKCPNPMLLYYDWCGGTPFAVQRKTCEMLTEHPRAYVLNAMGTGKTRTALWSWDYLNKNKLAKKMLVVAPFSTMHFTWAREAFSTLPGRKVVVLHGSRQDRLDKLAQDADIYVINHDGVKVIQEALSARADIDTLVLDELAVYRNDSARSRLMRKFVKNFAIVWGMTGAPMPNEPTDVWGQCMIVTPGMNSLPQARRYARSMLMTQHSTYIWTPKDTAVETAFKWMQPSVRYNLDDCLELPDVISRTIDVPLTSSQKVVYERVRTAMTALVRDQKITALNAGAAMSKLLQIAGGWVYTQNPEFVRLDASTRVAALADLTNSAERKVLVFVPFRHMLEGISTIFNIPAIGIEHAVVHGDVSNREQIFTLFQTTNKYKALLAHPACLSHGLTLTAADTIIWYLPITSLDIYNQANARIRRIGQMHRQQILHLQSTPVERRVYKMLQNKQQVQGKLLDLFEEATGDAE